MLPTGITSSISPTDRPAREGRLQGAVVRSTGSSTRASSGPRQLDVEMFRTGLVGGDEGQIDFRLPSWTTRFWLSAASFRRCRPTGGAPIDGVLTLFIGQIVDDTLVTPEEGVAIGRLTSNTPSPISRTETSKSPPRSKRRWCRTLLIQTMRQGGGGRLVDDAQDLEAGDHRRPWWLGAGRRRNRPAR